MGRRAGSRNADYAQTREALLRALKPTLLAPGGAGLSFRELAAAAGVVPTTLRYYFASREGVVIAMLEYLRREGAEFLRMAASRPAGPVEASLRWFLESTVMAWRRFSVGGAHALGLSAGLGDGQLGPAYVNELLEPTLQAAEARIARHVAEGELGACDVRHAALELLSPVVLGLLHQDNLLGASCRPLALEPFLEDHLARFLRAHAPEASGGSSPPR